MRSFSRSSLLFLMTALLSFGTNAADVKSSVPAPAPATKEKKEFKLSFIPAANKKHQQKEEVKTQDTASATTTYQSYTVVSGDTLEKIIIRFYGKNDVSKIDKIVEANKLKNANSLSIGQKLVIPMN